MSLFRFFFSLLLVSLFLAGCKDQKTPPAIEPVDIKIDHTAKITLGDLTIYPITGTNRSAPTPLLPIHQLISDPAVRIKQDIPGDGRFSYRSNIYFANKSDQAAYILKGDFIQTRLQKIILLQDSQVAYAKKITDAPILFVNGTNRSTVKQTYLSGFPCPPIPLKDFVLEGRNPRRWFNRAQFKYNLSSLKEIELTTYEELSNTDYTDIQAVDTLPPFEQFQRLFAPIGSDNNTGYVVAYQDKILLAYYFIDGDFFRKEWPYFIKSIYLQQAVGYDTDLTPFHVIGPNSLNQTDDLSALQVRLEQLWIKPEVTSKDNAHRGDKDSQPFYLVAF